MSRSRVRLVGAGLAAGVVGAVVLVGPEAALAAPMFGPSIVPVGGTATISDPQGNYLNFPNATVQLSTATCPTRYAAPLAVAPTSWNATVGTKTATSVPYTVPAGATPANANGAVKLYNVCLYDGSTPPSAANVTPVVAGSSLLASGTIYVGQPVSISATTGPSGGGNVITLNSGAATPLFSGLTTLAAVFTTGTCGGTFGTANPAAGMAATNVVRTNSTATLTVPPGVVTGPPPGPTVYNVCVYDSSAPGGLLQSFTQYTLNIVTLSPASGSYLSSNGVTATAATPFLSGVTSPAALLFGQGGGCPGIYTTGLPNETVVNPTGGVRRLTNNRAAVTIPTLQLAPNNQPNPYQVCFYSSANTTTGTLIGTASYTAAVVSVPTAVIPAAGPAAGGNTITVVGTDFPTDPGRITATLGGLPLTNIQPLSDKAFTAQVPAHTPQQGVALVVTTTAGTKALPGAYSYLNPITVAPNTAPNTVASVDVDVQGSGFLAINFGQSGNAGRVFLVNGVYDGSDADNGVRANGPVAECINVLPISDTELVCTLQLNRRLNDTATGFFNPASYTNGLTDVSTTAGSRAIRSPSGGFSPKDVGQPIVQQGNGDIPQFSLVTAVLSPAKAVISVPATATDTDLSVQIGGVAHSLQNALITATDSTTVSVAPGGPGFTAADVGRVFSGIPAVIPDGTTILSVAPGGSSATLSALPLTATAGTLTGVSVPPNGNTLTAANLAAGDRYAVIGNNALGIPVGTTIIGVSGNTATLSAQVTTGGNAASLPVNRPVSASLYAAAPVPTGSYQLTVVSDGAPDAAATDPNYTQTDVTSSSVFTVAPF